MKIKQLSIAAIMVISATVALSSCKKDSNVMPKSHQTIKRATIDSTALSGGGQGPQSPHKP
ncbi:hypothetical protein [Mucilaginibacter xinganensis]|uniref:Uncharacterized protein n=1 Tax=Mucilaginibacter xinganensis TaxID=1234841 RepID=A0A223P2P2_9SPHI|nr:hypothetical protein [Mucilaginibacter xinganensis]ASU36224.1 hypothetical protein MuYL_4339 [Mucilaginibacter xinganensis]